jgi:SAM-dependent methyltransferase
MNCRHCKAELSLTLVDLGFAPPSNAYLSKENLDSPETYYPLRVHVCKKCFLVQTEDYSAPTEIFNDNYAYFSSVSKSWLKHAKDFSTNMIDKLNLNKSSFIIEIASNDGYLLKNFVEVGIPCMGIEPTKSTALAAKKIGVKTLIKFFGRGLATKLKKENKLADLIIGNNVYAHVPDINDFTAGIKMVLKKEGVIVLEFPHLLNLIQLVQFDTIYHEHFSYLSLFTVRKIFEKYGLRVWNVEQISTHGGSLRVYGCHIGSDRQQEKAVREILELEKKYGLQKVDTYKNYQSNVNKIKNSFINFLLQQKENNKTVIGYGAAAKSNTLINYAGVKKDLIKFICDGAKSKQGKYLPGSHIPILRPDILKKIKADYTIIFPWNIRVEIVELLKSKYKWAGKFVIIKSSGVEII